MQCIKVVLVLADPLSLSRLRVYLARLVVARVLGMEDFLPFLQATMGPFLGHICILMTVRAVRKWPVQPQIDHNIFCAAMCCMPLNRLYSI